MQPQQMHTVLDKLRRLPPERVAEVEDFIDFLSSRYLDRPLVRAAQAVTEARLQALWDNDADADYDRL
jgi:hypothetical protein